MKVVDYQIEMLNVGAADAFIIYFIDESNQGHIVLVDAGNYCDGEKIVNHLRRYYSNPVIDLAIVTHPDDDHYGGYIKMLEKIQNNDSDKIAIKEFWVHDPANHVDKGEVKWIRKQSTVTVKARTVYDLGDRNLIDLIDTLGIPRVEKFPRVIKWFDTTIVSPAYPFTCFRILGPTKDYYKSLVPNFRNDELNFHQNESDEDCPPIEDIPDGSCLSQTLDNATDDTSAHNQSSLIFLFEPDNDTKFIFMGDSGRDAFDNLPTECKNKIKNVDWLKVPHHGSKHNMDSGMINWIKPTTAYISTAGKGKYLNQCTVNALKSSGCRVYSTHQEKTDFLHNGINARDSYSTATPL